MSKATAVKTSSVFLWVKKFFEFPPEFLQKNAKSNLRLLHQNGFPKIIFFYCDIRKKYNKDLIFSWTNVVQFQVKALIRFPVVVNCNLLRRKIPFNESWKSTVTRKNSKIPQKDVDEKANRNFIRTSKKVSHVFQFNFRFS